MRVASLLMGALFLLSAGCRRGPKPIPLDAAAEARRVVTARAVIPNLDRSFDRAEAVAQALSLPFDKANYRKQFLNDLKAPEALLASLRTDGPAAIVVFPPKVKGKDPGVVLAASAKSPDTLKTALAGLPQDARKDEVRTFSLQGVPVWVIQRGNLLVGATARELLTQGATLAMETAQAGEEDVAIHLYPEALAKSEGTDVKSAITQYLATLTASMKTMPGQNPRMIGALDGVFRALGDRLAEVEDLVMSMRLDAQKGAALRFELSPRSGSRLAGLLGKTAPYALDTRVLPPGDDTLAVMAFSPSEMMASLWADLRGLVANGKPGEDAAKQIDALVKAWSFGGSGAMAVVKKQMRLAGVYGLRKGADGAALLAATEGLVGGAWYQSLLSAGEMKSKVSVKREKDLLLIHTEQSVPKSLPTATANAMKGMGLLSQSMAMLTAQGSLFVASGDEASTAVRQLVTTPPRKLAGLLATAVPETAGADGFMYLDIGQFLKLGAAAMGAGENPMFAAMRLPLWLSYRGGKSAAFELRIPLEFAKGVSGFLPMIMGLGMGGGRPPMGL
jgi:hypothetical protein